MVVERVDSCLTLAGPDGRLAGFQPGVIDPDRRNGQ